MPDDMIPGPADDTLAVESLSLHPLPEDMFSDGSVRVQVIGSMAHEAFMPRHLRTLNIRSLIVGPQQIRGLQELLERVAPTDGQVRADMDRYNRELRMVPPQQ